MTPLRRAVLLSCALSVLCTMVPSPARAVTTQQEIRAGQAEDEQITSSEVIETDPLLNAYVQSIANKLWLQVARKDLPYNVKIIKASDINSFATEGGFVYIDEGMLDFVQSDDEFASVLGHETGHIERRHVVTLNTKAQILEVLLGLASIFSPFVMAGGGLLGQTIIEKMSREDEIEADRYGLQLMSRAGYDPDSMVTMMRHMGALGDEHSELMDKYLEDHPDPQARVSHLMGYPELDPRVVTEQQLLVRALSDAERARYSFAAIKLRQILHTNPDNVEALLHLANCQLALGLTSKSEQTLAEAARLGSPEARALVAVREGQLRDLDMRRVMRLREDPDFPALAASIAAARRALLQTGQQLQPQTDQAHDALVAERSRLTDLQDELPDFGSGTIRPNTHVASVVSDIQAMGRALNSAMDDDTQVVENVGSLATNKESGLLENNAEILNEMAGPLGMHPVPDDALGVLPSYPGLLTGLSFAEDDMTRAIQTARASLAQMDQGVNALDSSLRALDEAQVGYNGDLGNDDFAALRPRMSEALQSFNAAAIAASQAAQLYNMARARQMSVRITLLGLGSSPERYGTLQYALEQRFGMNGIDYGTMVRDGITAGDVTVATILAADIRSTPQAIVDESLRTKTSIVDLANEHGMHAWPLAIFMDLVYYDYTDDPVKELATGAPAGAAGDD